MITIIPTLEILKAVTDFNITSDGGELRRKSFDMATELITLGDIHVLLDGFIYERIKPRLQKRHQTHFESTYRIDNSVKGLVQYNTTQSVIWIAKSESRARKTIIISDNKNDYINICSDSIKVVSPSEFLEKTKSALSLNKFKILSSVEDALITVFFFMEGH